jgi:lysophospholipase L1-like esterase
MTIAVIGGSITAGACASTEQNRYGNQIAKWWQETFPKANIRLVNAGIGATGSNYGALRASRDVFSHHPDLVVVEYSVNDPNSRASAETLEGLIRQILAQPNQPAVVSLYMMSEGGHNAQEWHAKVAEHYRLPRVSFRDALWPDMQAGKIQWKDYIADAVHPNDRGHAFAGKLVSDLIAAVYQQLPTDAQLPAIGKTPAPLFSDLYEHTQLFEAGSLQPVANSGWTFETAGDGKYWKADKPGSRIEFELDGKAILLMDFHIRGNMGQAKVQVDDRPPVTREAWFEQTWGGYRQTDEIARDLAAGKHRVSIEVLEEKNAQSNGHEYRLFGLGAAGTEATGR